MTLDVSRHPTWTVYFVAPPLPYIRPLYHITLAIYPGLFRQLGMSLVFQLLG